MDRVRSVLPSVKRLRVRPARVQKAEYPLPDGVDFRNSSAPIIREVIGDELLFDLNSGDGVSARAVSEGTLLVTALLTAIMWTPEINCLLIDDLERGLHPKAQRELVGAIKLIQAADPALQVVFSTHSPYIADELDASPVVVVASDEQARVHARRLSEHPNAERALEVLSTGEFLSAEGEDWVLDSAANS